MPTNPLDPLDPRELKDYMVDWSLVLEGESDTTISASTWAASVPVGLTINSQTNVDTKAIVWVSGGVAGRVYGLTNEIETVGGRTHRRTIFIPVKPL